MPPNPHLATLLAEEERQHEADNEFADQDSIRTRLKAAGEQASLQVGWLPGTTSSRTFFDRARRVRSALKPVFAGVESRFVQGPLSDDLQWLRDNAHLVLAQSENLPNEVKSLRKLPHVRTQRRDVVPRALAVGELFLEQTQYRFSEQSFSAFCEGFQENGPFDLRELWVLVPGVKLVLLEQIAIRGHKALRDPNGPSKGIATCVRSLREVVQSPWKEILEPLIMIDRVLRQDPAGLYAQMDFESRNYYRDKIARIARRSDCNEMQAAQAALTLAREAKTRTYADPRIALRESHVGYYIVGEGRPILCRKVACKQDFGQTVRALLRRHPDEFFLPGIAILTLGIVSAILLWLTPPDTSPELILLSMLILLLPSSQSAVQLMNYLVTAILPAQILPKLDFSEGIPPEFATLVAIPTLLLNEKQVRNLVDDLEVRFLGNHDPNIHYALLSDLPDSDQPTTEESPLIDLCRDLIRELNERYAGQAMGSFLLLHRHRTYNPREKGWMGWERKRGKLMDLNKFLRGKYDNFPVKEGDLSILPKVQFVITLDSDTELPRGAAQRMIGTLAHPLNRAIIDPEKNIVVAGYGILQPRVGVSVLSTARSRLAAIYAGESGFDIYTHAISDAYQELYGEGSFTGKGIYEVDSVLRVLERRFPRNALLSHDLIEGAYARSGLASDIEVIEDYPSHYSAYNRRKHRWLRGDWQITEWLTSTVPDESGARVRNPISLVSRWKILDNLRRSLVEPAIFVLLLFGWLIPTGHPVRWTFATVFILFIPVWFQLLAGLTRSIFERRVSVARDAVNSFYSGNFTGLLTLVFLAHQMFLSLDAMVRALVRRLLTRERLLEWETAEQAEMGRERRTPLDRYLDLMPLLALAVGGVIWLVRPSSLYAAVPILLLWACSKGVSLWLNESPIASGNEFPRKDVQFMRKCALHTWRYFAEFSTEEHHWLIPDNVQEQPPATAARVSTTNLGLLLNARQVACELGYLTVPELVRLTHLTLDTMSSIPKFRGHLLNWYDTRTLEPLNPRFISSVDNGNLLASLWTLQQGLLDRLRQPLLQPALAQGLLDSMRKLAEMRAFPRKELAQCERDLRSENWVASLLALPESIVTEQSSAKSKQLTDIAWFQKEAGQRLRSIHEMVRLYAPWWLPEFAPLREDAAFGAKMAEHISPQLLPAFIDALKEQLSHSLAESADLSRRLLALLPEARAHATLLIDALRRTAALAGKLANQMDFSFLLDSRRKLLSIGFDVDANELHSACYDLLASEARIATFAAIAKEDIPQDCWFNLGRSHTLDQGRLVLVSWTGTMFEYLMPALWMRSYSNTLLDRSRLAAVRSQQAYAAKRGVPWGISESSYSKLDDAGNYQYRAFGVPQLALMKSDSSPLVISPYSTFLALNVDPEGAIRNLRRMDSMGWFGPCGFYEAADYTVFRSRFRWTRCEITRLWMAHHQGMSLLAIGNFLCNNVVQRWFHSERRVQATELLLHEKPVSHLRGTGLRFSRAA
ncbi:MAG TPA: glucoamylase family protein [Candidatus Sulfotelmatobacter sp.]|nr:glucoamylase family protein [Candidatus Sulfotelmatobacter sp.]